MLGIGVRWSHMEADGGVCIVIDCLLITLDAHMFSHNGYGPGTKDRGPKAAGPGPAAFSGPWFQAHIHYG